MIVRPFRRPPATVAFNMRIARGPWGGSSPFVAQLAAHLRRLGLGVTFRLGDRVDAVVLVDPRDGLEGLAFGLDAIRAWKAAGAGRRVLHRVNECDQRKDTRFMDEALARASELADHTVFISEWLRDYHLARWFDPARPHAVIYNGADPAVFHPLGGAVYRGEEPLRVVTHHWSDNWLKGFREYRELDERIAGGRLPGVEFTVIGRWPREIVWRAARTHPPCAGPALAGLLRRAHVYVTASRWEPCGMHHVEGAQCGLPLLYHEDGGGIVEAGRRYGLPFRDDVGAGLLELRARYGERRAAVLRDPPGGDAMCAAYARVLTGLIAGGAAASGDRGPSVRA